MAQPTQAQATLGSVTDDGTISERTPTELLESVTPGDRIRYNDKQRGLVVTSIYTPEEDDVSARRVVVRGPQGGKYQLRVPNSEDVSVMTLDEEGMMDGGVTFLEVVERRDRADAPRVRYYDD